MDNSQNDTEYVRRLEQAMWDSEKERDQLQMQMAAGLFVTALFLQAAVLAAVSLLSLLCLLLSYWTSANSFKSSLRAQYAEDAAERMVHRKGADFGNAATALFNAVSLFSLLGACGVLLYVLFGLF